MATSIPQESLRREIGSTSMATPTPRVSQPQEVEWYGAVGDGTTDDTAAIQAAITAAGAYGIVLFKPGKTYLMTSQIVIAAAGVTLLGYGATITSATSAQYQKFRFSGAARGAALGIKFNCIYVSGATSIAAGVVEIWNSSDVQVQDCEFNDVSNVGVYLFGTTTRAIVAFNRFYKNFCAIFSDDDLTNQPTDCQIINNQIRTGLGTTATNLSGAIKMSGVGSVTTIAGHVISHNVIDTPGQMGIEIQGWVNDCTIANNTISGPAFGISVSGCSRITETGNVVRNATSVGCEVASGSSFVTMAGATITSTAATGDGVSTSGSSTDVAISGCHFAGWSNSVHLATIARASVSGCTMYLPASAHVNIQAGTDVVVAGCTFEGNASTYQFITLDSTSAAIARVVIAKNTFNGTVSNNGITLLAPAGFTISDVLVTGNNTAGMTTPGGGISYNASINPATNLIRIRVYDNMGNGNGDISHSFTREGLYATADFNAFFWPYFLFERATVRVDASAGARTVNLPPALGLGGFFMTFVKIDNSINAVTLTRSSADTINGANSYALTAQYSRVTVISLGNADGWLIIQSN